jgi:hypothetical protein
MATTVTIGPNQSSGDVQASPITIGDNLMSIVAVKAGMAKVTIVTSGAGCRVGLGQTVTQGAARVSSNYVPLPSGGTFDVLPNHCGVSGHSAWQIAVSNSADGETPVITPVGAVA